MSFEPLWSYRYEYRDGYSSTDFPAREVRSIRRTDAVVPAGSQAYAWLDYVVLENHADAGENCARYTKAFNAGNGAAWGECIEVADLSFGAAPDATLRGGELSIAACGEDPGNGRRLGWHVLAWDAKRHYAGAPHDGPCEVSTAFRFNGESNAYFGVIHRAADFRWAFAELTGGYHGGQPSHHIFRFEGKFITGFSFAGAEFSGSPIRLGRGQTIAFEETDSVTVGLHGDRVELRLCGVPFMAVDINTGDLFIKGRVRSLNE